jgi:glucose/arabinose dehydrogenase
MPLTPSQVQVTKLTDGFAFGVKMARLSDGRWLITEKETGRVRLVTDAFALEPQPVLDVAVNYAGERGLLGIAAHPDFARNGYVYIAYVASTTPQDSADLKGVGDIRVARFRLTGTVADGPPQTLITLPGRPGPYHNGGCLLFGPDGKLYVSLGELNRHANLNSQLTGKPQGKLLRYNDDGSVPLDNPLGAGNPMYIYGVRNAFGFAFDRQGDGVFVSDNGPKGHDRLAKAFAGENLGWPLIWGIADTWYERLAAWWLGQRFRPSLWESFRDHAVPTAVQVLPHDLYGPALRGRVLMSAFGQGQVLQFALDPATRSTVVGIGPFVSGLPGIVDLQFGADDRLYVLTVKALYRLDPVASQ